MPVDRKTCAFAAGVLLLAALTLSGCSSTIADLPAVGIPADAPARPKEPGSYLPVHDLPPDREDAPIAPAEQAKITNELAAARDRQASVPAPTPAVPPVTPTKKPAAKKPAVKPD
jgi:hypothetical protein